ncbi:unnamed protein product [Arabidopsis thaliana]|uniref:(thale cress) hypothetical protein n=1 Tax=Arabidopsis thaliana TaxID=3702 RepID=A0A7G2EU28_ARATH|nr:unnamed protein product [Arabidopsis thaliana]
MAQRFYLLLLLLIFLVNLICFSSQQDLSFVFNGFDQDQAGDELLLDGFARIQSPERVLQLTDGTTQEKGHAFFNLPFEFGSASSQSLSFFTHFVCVLVPKPGVDGGHGIAFVLSSSNDFRKADPSQYLGLFNISTNGSPSSHVLAVELDTVQSAEFDDIDNNHVGIDVNSLQSVFSASASYYSNREGKNISLLLLSGDPIQVWIDYEDTQLNVTLAPLREQKPSKPLLSRTTNLTAIFPDRRAFLGFSAATGSLINTRLRGNFTLEEVEMVLKLGLLCTSTIPEARPNMEKVVQYINRDQALPDFSPDTPGIGVSTPMVMGIPGLAITSSSVTSSVSVPLVSPPSPNNSMFISHTILNGDGR